MFSAKYRVPGSLMDFDPVWKLYEHAIARAGVTATLLEWDDRIPSFDEVHAEARKAERYLPAPVADLAPA